MLRSGAMRLCSRFLKVLREKKAPQLLGAQLRGLRKICANVGMSWFLVERLCSDLVEFVGLVNIK